jgi:transcriptional regulator with XRE-family HTH domain
VAIRSRVSQATISRLEAGDPRLSLLNLSRIVAAVGMDLSVRAFPAAGIGLRDSGQLALAEVVRAAAHRSWRIGFEVPTREDAKQAADLVLFGAVSGLHIELESRLVDFQAQLRSGTLKRDALQQRYSSRFAFVLALRDTAANRAAVRIHRSVIGAALPAGPSHVWHSIRSGLSLAVDGLLWIRPAPLGRSDSHMNVMPRDPSDSEVRIPT